MRYGGDMSDIWGIYGGDMGSHCGDMRIPCRHAHGHPQPRPPTPTSNSTTPNPAPTPNLTLFSLSLCLIETETQALWPDTLAVAYRLPVGVSDPSFVIRWPTPTDRR